MEYTYVLVIHIVSVMSWMAVMFYLPRLFVYHREHCHNKNFVSVVEIQEKKLFFYIGIPSFIGSILSGLYMMHLNIFLFEQNWFLLKCLILVLLIVYFFSMEYYRLSFLKNINIHSGEYFRAYNEVPTAMSILIIIYAITKDTMILTSLIVLILFGIIIFKIATTNNRKNDSKSLEKSA